MSRTCLWCDKKAIFKGSQTSAKGNWTEHGCFYTCAKHRVLDERLAVKKGRTIKWRDCDG